MEKYRFIITAAILFVMFITMNSVPAFSQEKPIDSDELKKTTITPHLDEGIVAGKNIIFCDTFQLAWNELTGKILKGDLLMKNAPALAGILNKMRRVITGKDISDKYYLAMAGYGKDNIVNRINTALKKKFGDEAWLVKENLDSRDILAYAFLMKNLSFTTQFDDLPHGITFKGKDTARVRVKAFGIPKFSPGKKMKELSKQVTVAYYNSDKNEFVVKLKTDSPNDELVLARIEPGSNMTETYNKARSLAARKPDKLSYGDVLIIPEIEFFIEHHYKELLNKNFLNRGFEQYFISKAIQTTKFKLDKTGARLKSKAVIAVRMNGGGKYKKLVFNKPFMLYMKEKKARNPYFVMWIDNVEVLVKK